MKEPKGENLGSPFASLQSAEAALPCRESKGRRADAAGLIPAASCPTLRGMSDTPEKPSPAQDLPTKYIPVQIEREYDPKHHYITFYLPSRNNDGKALDFRIHSDLKIAIMTFLLKEFGGATLTEGKGYFISSKDGRTHEEEVTLCRSFCTYQELHDNDRMVRSIANALAIEGDQDTISVEIDDVMYFYKPTAVYRKIYESRVRADKSDYHQLLAAAEDARKEAEKKKAEEGKV